ncbi:MAG: aminotransferase class V-fold PLP-dependent enzyme [Bacteroides sp.]|nr:aminotransferase class V-fold PLP-dependent enzyme [Eubacterium sp.]MCM1418258.1 aminotransferase class V-fold PLP-dependent enzyme [Roseburia sp.]MCM1462360.1 aminotransferase class V-fold PLP-dependent enzyme [Bacteroides sp.]
MIYFDNAATTYPKPRSVIAAMSGAMIEYGANPGRAGHRLSMKTAEAVYNAREKCASFFGAETENTVFMPNCTFALNTAIKGVLSPGSHIVTSDIEHNAVLRPIYAMMKEYGVSCSFARTGDDEATVREFERLINRRTRAVVCTLAGNVTGRILPIRRIAAICQKKGICLIVDAAQGAGVLPIRLSDGVNIICAAGHKGLYGPMGTGLMITDGRYRLKTLVEGGTGSASKEMAQPEFLPDRFESGTINTAGAISLGAGVDFVKNRGIEVIYRHETAICRRFFEEMKKNPRVRLYSDGFDERYAPVIPFNVGELSSEEVSARLSDMGFCLRGGLHCAYPAHKKLGTGERGAVRFSPSVFSTMNETLALARAVDRIAAEA